MACESSRHGGRETNLDLICTFTVASWLSCVSIFLHPAAVAVAFLSLLLLGSSLSPLLLSIASHRFPPITANNENIIDCQCTCVHFLCFIRSGHPLLVIPTRRRHFAYFPSRPPQMATATTERAAIGRDDRHRTLNIGQHFWLCERGIGCNIWRGKGSLKNSDAPLHLCVDDAKRYPRVRYVVCWAGRRLWRYGTIPAFLPPAPQSSPDHSIESRVAGAWGPGDKPVGTAKRLGSSMVHTLASDS
jgi:hypothetical protein